MVYPKTGCVLQNFPKNKHGFAYIYIYRYTVQSTEYIQTHTPKGLLIFGDGDEIIGLFFYFILFFFVYREGQPPSETSHLSA